MSQVAKDALVLSQKINQMVTAQVLALFQEETGVVTLDLNATNGRDYVVEVKTKRKRATKKVTKKAGKAKVTKKKATRRRK